MTNHPDDRDARPMPEFSEERARLLAERPAHPWTPPDGVAWTESDLLDSTEEEADEEPCCCYCGEPGSDCCYFPCC